MPHHSIAGWVLATAALAGSGAVFAASADGQWDSVVGSVTDVGDPTPHWFTLRGRHIAYMVDGDKGEVQGTMTLSMFSPAVAPHIESGRIFSYGAFYTRTYYGDRTDAVLTFDAKTMQPVNEVIIPPKSAGIGHSGMIGLIDERFIGVWNITPAMSVSVVDVAKNAFVGELSTPGCAAVYPIGRGFLMPCGDGTFQYISLNAQGKESGRIRGKPFFEIEQDPVFDYAVPSARGWMFVSLDGLVYEATVEDGAVLVSEPWSILTEEDLEEGWRIGGRQPFAYNAETGLLVTLMHKGGGQETFEDPGTEIWGFSTRSQRRGYRLELEGKASGVQLTKDAAPLMVLSPSGSETLSIHDGRSGRQLRVMEEIGGGLIQNL